MKGAPFVILKFFLRGRRGNFMRDAPFVVVILKFFFREAAEGIL